MPEAKDYGTVGMLLLPSVRPLHEDEEVMSLFEQDELTPDGKRLVRMQTIRVMRGDKLVEFPREMGPSANYKAGPFVIPCLGAHSVGEVLEMAERIRPILAAGVNQAMAEHAADFNVIEAAIRQREMTREYTKRNHRTFMRDSTKG